MGKAKKPEGVTLYKKELRERMIALREGASLTQEQVRKSLRIPLDRYKKWEQRGSIPLAYVEGFANLVGATVMFVITGREAEPARKQA